MISQMNFILFLTILKPFKNRNQRILGLTGDPNGTNADLPSRQQQVGSLVVLWSVYLYPSNHEGPPNLSEYCVNQRLPKCRIRLVFSAPRGQDAKSTHLDPNHDPNPRPFGIFAKNSR